MVGPHQDEWWPHHGHASVTVMEKRIQRLRAEGSPASFDLAEALWLLDRPGQALEVIGSDDAPPSRALRAASLRRMGREDEAEAEYADLAGTRLAQPLSLEGVLANNSGWLSFRRWLGGVRTPAGPSFAHLETARGKFAHARFLGEPFGTLNLAALALASGEVAEAKQLLEPARTEFAASASTGHLRRTGFALLGEVALWEGEWGSAAESFKYALDASGPNGDIVVDAHLLMMVGITDSERGFHVDAVARLRRALAAWRRAAQDSEDATRPAGLAEAAQRCARYLALAEVRRALAEGRTAREPLRTLAAQADSTTWQGLLSLMLAGERKIPLVLKSVPADLGATRTAELEAQARLTAARRLVLDEQREAALELLAEIGRPLPGGVPLAFAEADALRSRLKKGELVP